MPPLAKKTLPLRALFAVGDEKTYGSVFLTDVVDLAVRSFWTNLPSSGCVKVVGVASTCATAVASGFSRRCSAESYER